MSKELRKVVTKDGCDHAAGFNIPGARPLTMRCTQIEEIDVLPAHATRHYDFTFTSQAFTEKSIIRKNETKKHYLVTSYMLYARKVCNNDEMYYI